jgi:hypothetical protein
MAGEWPSALLRDLIEFTRDGEWGSEQPTDNSVEMLVVRGTDFSRFRVGELTDIPRRHIERSASERKQLRPGDVLIETAGGTKDQSTGRTAFVSQNHLEQAGLPVTCASFARFLRFDRARVEPRFMFWWLQCLYASGQMETHQVQHTGVARFQFTKFIESTEAPVPPLTEQRAIAHVLGTLDDKIELNRRMNETLEEMAQALFKSWFVDFDPVRAKAGGRQPARMDVETAALFPDSFIESELGLLPKGWDIKPVGEIIEDLFDGPHATPAEASEGAVYLGIKNLTGTQIDLTEIRYISELDWPQWTKRVVPRPHDIVFTYEATLGAFVIVPADLRCCLGRRLALVRPKTGQLDYCFLFHTFVSKAFQELLMARANQGSTVNRIPLIDFPKYPVIWPAR